MTNNIDNIWFSGPVKDAITLVGQRTCVLLVYITDDSEKTTILNEELKNEKVIEAIREQTVALSMEKGSENALLFGQFYPIQNVPILYFIKQGTIRDFATESATSQEIVDKINRVYHLAIDTSIQQQQPVTTAPPTDSIPAAVQLISVPTETIIQEPSSSLTSTPNTEQIKAKKAELQKQLEQVRLEKAEREKQEAKDREIKRRQEAKLMQDAKQSRADKENKLYFEKIRKEKLEDEAHRKRVRQQIATDRAEKIAQRNAEKNRQNSTCLVTDDDEGAKSKISNHEFSNLNIRQLDGTNIRNQFEATATLLTVRDWIKQNRTDDKRKSYKLSSQFPTRLFTDMDDNTTLAELNLCPSATIIMKPLISSSVSMSSSNNSSQGIVGFLYGIIVTIINLITGFFYTLFPNNASHESLQQQQQQPTLRNLKGGQRLGGESIGESSSAANKERSMSAQRRNPYSTRVNTLQEDDFDDDEKKKPTYNGNSVNHE